MDINSLPNGARVMVDANIFIYYLGGASPDCKAFLRRVALGEIAAHITTIILAETLHRRMIAEAVAKGLISPGQPVKKLKADPAVILSLSDYITEIDSINRACAGRLGISDIVTHDSDFTRVPAIRVWQPTDV